MFHTRYIDLYVCRENRNCATVVRSRKILGKRVLHVGEKVKMTGGIIMVKGGKYEKELKWGIW